MRLNVKNIEKGHTFTVLVDNEDVSNRCYGFDTIEGWADCYVLNESGQLEIKDNGSSHGWKTFGIVKERLFGDVIAINHVNKGETGKNE